MDDINLDLNYDLKIPSDDIVAQIDLDPIDEELSSMIFSNLSIMSPEKQK